MSQRNYEVLPPNGIVLVVCGVLLMLLTIVPIFFGIPSDPFRHPPLGGEELFSQVDKLFASFVFGCVLLVAGIIELEKSPPRISPRTRLIAKTLIATTLVALVLGA